MPGHRRSKNGVASLAYVPGIHVISESLPNKAWMAGTSPAMTSGFYCFSNLHALWAAGTKACSPGTFLTSVTRSVGDFISSGFFASA